MWLPLSLSFPANCETRLSQKRNGRTNRKREKKRERSDVMTRHSPLHPFSLLAVFLGGGGAFAGEDEGDGQASRNRNHSDSASREKETVVRRRLTN